jgi:hypothetical protein
MAIRAVPPAGHTQTSEGFVTVALAPSARHSLGCLQQRTGQSQADLATCAITWYAYLDNQLRAGYNLTLWSDDAGKAYTLSLSVGSPAVLRGVPWLPGLGAVRGTGGRARGAPSFCLSAAGPSTAHAFRRLRHGLPPSPLTAATAQPWLTVATSRGSPAAAAAPRGGAAQPLGRFAVGIPASKAATTARNGGPS